MKILVDTCIWSLALIRSDSNKDLAVVTKLKDLVQDSLVQMIGPIRQELLSGISSLEQFNKLKKYLSAFSDITHTKNDYELAAELYNICRKKGIQGSNTDFLICATAINYKLAIFTIDNDFNHFANYIPINIISI